MNKTICIGLGYIGFPTAAMLAGKGLTVVGVDINERVVEYRFSDSGDAVTPHEWDNKTKSKIRHIIIFVFRQKVK